MSTDSSVAALNAGKAPPVVLVKPSAPSLEVQIIEAENAVLQRDRQVRDSLLVVATRAREVGSQAGIALAIAAAGVVVGWLLLRGRGPAARATVVAPKVKRRASLALVQLGAFVWPLLPPSLKSRASSALVQSVLRAAGPRSSARSERPAAPPRLRN